MRARRLALGLSLRRLAERSGVTPSDLSRIERGLTDPRLSVARRIAEALQSTVDELWPAE